MKTLWEAFVTQVESCKPGNFTKNLTRRKYLAKNFQNFIRSLPCSS